MSAANDEPARARGVCRVIEIKAVASHNVIFGVVEAIKLGAEGPALVYHGRVYKSV